MWPTWGFLTDMCFHQRVAGKTVPETAITLRFACWIQLTYTFVLYEASLMFQICFQWACSRQAEGKYLSAFPFLVQLPHTIDGVSRIRNDQITEPILCENLETWQSVKTFCKRTWRPREYKNGSRRKPSERGREKLVNNIYGGVKTEMKNFVNNFVNISTGAVNKFRGHPPVQWINS